MTTFQTEVPVRFGHCDPAGIVFYPRYFDMINAVVEDWFEDGIGTSFPGLMYHQGLTTPTVHFNVDFSAESRFGDRLTFRLNVKKIGKTSVETYIEASAQGTVRMKVEQVLVFIDIKSRKPTQIPEDLVKRIERYKLEAKD
ncbi:MAG: thioesterase family protein [Pseudomonadota bacterium]